ncbi:MAG: protein tyrosine phosphatase family protein [Acidimicrobiales bacterium]
MTLEATMNYRRIDDRVTTSGAVPLEVLGGLKAAGYEAVINLMPDDSDWAVPGEADSVTGQGLGYVYLPVDFTAPTTADLDAFVDAMDANEGKVVHVHCAANYRVSAFYALYAQRKGIWTAEQAAAHIEDVWGTDDYPVWRAFVADEQARLAG